MKPLSLAANPSLKGLATLVLIAIPARFIGSRALRRGD